MITRLYWWAKAKWFQFWVEPNLFPHLLPTRESVLIVKRFKSCIGRPLRCTHCGSSNIVEKIVALEGSFISEQRSDCGSCGKYAGYCIKGEWINDQ